MLASIPNLVLLKLGTLRYPKLAYAKSFTEKLSSFKQILFQL